MAVSFSCSNKLPENTPPFFGCGRLRGGAARLLSRDRIPVPLDPQDGCSVRRRTLGGEFSPARFLRKLDRTPAKPWLARRRQISPRPSDAQRAPNRNCWHSPDCRKPAARPARELPLHVPGLCNARSIRSREEAVPDAASCHSPVVQPA